MQRSIRRPVEDFAEVFRAVSRRDAGTIVLVGGHADGGVLAMKTYGHFRPDHSQLAAQKVSFS